MWIKTLKLKNIGPIEELALSFPFNEDGSPKILLLVGLNGTGKSLILSYLVDSLIEFKRQFYKDLEVEKNKYFKVSSKTYIKFKREYGFCEIIFKEEQKEFFYSEILTVLPYEEFKKSTEIKLELKDLT